MPVIRGQGAEGPYYKWGDAGKHYGYVPGDAAGREAAKDKALRQGRAIVASQERAKKAPAPAAEKKGGGRRPKKHSDPLSSAARSAAKAGDRKHLGAEAKYRASHAPRLTPAEKKKAADKAARAARG
jgi:hypothetical protein